MSEEEFLAGITGSDSESTPFGMIGTRVPAGEEERWGVYIGAGLGGVRTIEDTIAATKAKGPRYGFSPYFVTDIIMNEAPGMVSIRTGATGPELLARLGLRDGRALDRRGHARRSATATPTA